MRLSDIERKVLRIIINVSFYGTLPTMPTIADLQKWTGRSRGGVYTVLAGLARKEHIEWSAERPEKIKLLRKEHRLSGC